MKGIISEKPGEPFKITEDLPAPEPSPDQIVVRSIYVAINPVDELMRSSGVLVQDWPLVPGVDVAGIVVKVGDNATSFKVGDHVFGCTRLGCAGYSGGQEYFLMDAALALPKPKELSPLEAVTIGVGLETAALGIFDGLDVEFPNVENEETSQKDEWAVVLGGSSSVGKFGVQLLSLCGYKVIASCSANSVSLVKKQGAEAVFDYKEPIEEQVKKVLSVTEGKVHRVFDAVATGDAFAKALFQRIQGNKYFSTTNSWSGITDFEGGITTSIELGYIGRPEGEHINDLLSKWIPGFVKLLERGKLFPSPFDLVGQVGFGSFLEALEYQRKGAGGSSKVVAKIQDE